MRGPRIVLTGTVVALCLIAFLVAGDLRAEKPTKTVTGIVKVFEEDRGRVRSVYIKDPEQGDFFVVRGTDLSKELLKQVGTTVKATGYVRKPLRDPEFEQSIDVLKYEIVPSDGSAPGQTQAPPKLE